MTDPPAGRAQRALDRYARYNASTKGRARRDRYEQKHPERRQRWDVIMRIRARQLLSLNDPPTMKARDDGPAHQL